MMEAEEFRKALTGANGAIDAARHREEMLKIAARMPDQGESVRWISVLPEYLEGLRKSGLRPPICLMMQVLGTRVIMAVRLEAVAYDPRADPAEGTNPLELAIRLAVPECEVPRAQRVLDEHTRRTIRGVQRRRGAAPPGAVAGALAEADSAGADGPQHQLLVHDGGRIREIYGEERTREVILRIIRRKNRLSGLATFLIDREGNRVVRQT